MPSGGQIKTVNVSISRDSISEPAEQIVIIITNVTGGASLPSISNPLKVILSMYDSVQSLWHFHCLIFMQSPSPLTATFPNILE